jgi:hypothetical protein
MHFFSPNVCGHRSVLSVRYVDQRYSMRFISSVPETRENSSASKPAPSQPGFHRKVKVDLRPGPVKPKTSTLSSHVPTVSTKSTVPLPRPSSAPSLGLAKEVSKRDIEEAEAHGILTPPPPGANWFGRTLHKGIQLAVRTTYFLCSPPLA